MGRPLIDLTGKVFGKWTVVSRDGTRHRQPYWNVVCECGARSSQSGVHLRRGESKGCLQCRNDNCGTHRLSGHILFKRWHGLRSRCLDPLSTGYPHYGAKGVYVCDRWVGITDGLINFVADMEPTYFEGAHLDKDKFAIPGETKCYSPETCCWITEAENYFIRNHPELYPIKRGGLDPFISYKLATS
jgi:hypothetical protein